LDVFDVCCRGDGWSIPDWENLKSCYVFPLLWFDSTTKTNHLDLKKHTDFPDTSHVPVGNEPTSWPPGLLLPAFLRTAHPNMVTLTTAHFLGSSAVHQPVQCPFCACSERTDCLQLFSGTAHPNNVTLDMALPGIPGNNPAQCEVDRTNGCRGNLDNRHIHTVTHSIVVRCLVAW